MSLLALYWEIGWNVTGVTEEFYDWIARATIGLFSILEISVWISSPDRRKHARDHRILLIGAALLIVSIAAQLIFRLEGFAQKDLHLWSLGFVTLVQSTILGGAAITALQRTHRQWQTQIHPGILAMLSFVGVILIGAALLNTPNAAVSNHPIGWIDAVFTSTSAVCVTGLIVLDTGTDFTRTGQLILLGLMQIGGIGVMTLAYLFAVAGGGHFSLTDRVLLRDMVNEDSLSQVRGALFRIVGLTVLFEMSGFLLLRSLWRATPGQGMENLDWHALFHSISAYCNAGFSTFSLNLAAPEVLASGKGLSVISILIVAGGLGIPVWMDIYRFFFSRLKRISSWGKPAQHRIPFRLHTRIALTTTALLVAGGAIILTLGAPDSTVAESHPRALIALFDSITARTAGFNIQDMSEYAPGATLALIVLMFIGGCPGGTAGGVKTTSFALTVLNLRQVIRERSVVQIGRRIIPPAQIQQAFAIVTLAALWILCSALLVQLLQPEFKFIDVMFESTSAFATVGLSRGITAELSTASKCILITNMFVGRVGILLIFRALCKSRPKPEIQYPSESVQLN